MGSGGSWLELLPRRNFCALPSGRNLTLGTLPAWPLATLSGPTPRGYQASGLNQ